MQWLLYKYVFCCTDGYLAIFLILCSPAKNWPVLNHFLLWGDSSGVSLSSILNAMATAHACWGQSIWNYINSVPPVCLIISILWPVPTSSVKTPTHDSLSVMRSVCLLGPAIQLLPPARMMWLDPEGVQLHTGAGKGHLHVWSSHAVCMSTNANAVCCTDVVSVTLTRWLIWSEKFPPCWLSQLPKQSSFMALQELLK